ncbi:MAG: 50S ribosomal protein L32 [Candidatus Harrisonbacteria bacterium]|nr:50S ribosomal protein L32 [Candidatus Harrisonbacteria bacterium]
MPVPKKRNSKSKVGRRRANKSLSKASVLVCKNCKAPVRAHRACSNCGAYKGRNIKK